MVPPFLCVPDLSSAHGFFGRQGGVSTGEYASLNVGRGSDDDADAVAENRQRCQRALDASALYTAYQTHSSIARLVTEDDLDAPAMQGDAVVTALSGVAVGVVTADCVPLLFESSDMPLVGAAHAGWKGSLGGIIEAIVALMAHCGGQRDGLRCVIGPSLRAPEFEVGDDLRDQFVQAYPTSAQFFTARTTPGKYTFDHIGFVRWRLKEAGLRSDRIIDAGGNTLSEPHTYFSYRAARQAGALGYGRNLSAIVCP